MMDLVCLILTVGFAAATFGLIALMDHLKKR
jgi:hypothetical protein